MVLRYLAGGCLLLCLWSSFSSLRFSISSARAQGTVDYVEARDDRCTKKKDSRADTSTRSRDCTLFSATVRFPHDGREHVIAMSAGKAHGHGQPLSRAELRVGQVIGLVFAADAPKDAIRSDGAAFNLWGGPVFALLLACGLGFLSTRPDILPMLARALGSLSEKRRYNA